MELSQLRAFVAVSRERNIAKAAMSISMTASPVSRIIRELERQLRGPLIERGYHELALTSLGERILPFAVDIVGHADALPEILAGQQPTLRLGATPWARGGIERALVVAAEEVLGYFPAPIAEVSSDLLVKLQHNDLDVAVVHLPVDIVGISTRPLARYKFSVLCLPSDEIAHRTSVRLADLTHRTIVLPPESMQPAPMSSLRGQLEAAGIAKFGELDLREIVSTRSRMRRTGELVLGSRNSASLRMAGPNELLTVPLEDDLKFELGLAWRTVDSVRGVLVTSLAARIAPLPGEPLEVVD